MRPASGEDTAIVALELRSYLGHWWQEMVHLDGKVWTSLRLLLKSPGELAAAYLEPHREGGARRVVHPVRLYLTVNIVFFFLAPWINSDRIAVWKVEHASVAALHPALDALLVRSIERSGLDGALFRVILDERMTASQGAWVFLLIPVVALAGFTIARRHRRYFVEHLVLATNLVSFVLVSVLGFSLALSAAILLEPLPRVLATVAIVAFLSWTIWIALTIYRSVRSFYALTRRWAAAAVSLWLGGACAAGMWIYFLVLFLTALLSLRGLVVPARS